MSKFKRFPPCSVRGCVNITPNPSTICNRCTELGFAGVLHGLPLSMAKPVERICKDVGADLSGSKYTSLRSYNRVINDAESLVKKAQYLAEAPKRRKEALDRLLAKRKAERLAKVKRFQYKYSTASKLARAKGVLRKGIARWHSRRCGTIMADSNYSIDSYRTQKHLDKLNPHHERYDPDYAKEFYNNPWTASQKREYAKKKAYRHSVDAQTNEYRTMNYRPWGRKHDMHYSHGSCFDNLPDLRKVYANYTVPPDQDKRTAPTQEDDTAYNNLFPGEKTDSGVVNEHHMVPSPVGSDAITNLPDRKRKRVYEDYGDVVDNINPYNGDEGWTSNYDYETANREAMVSRFHNLIGGPQPTLGTVDTMTFSGSGAYKRKAGDMDDEHESARRRELRLRLNSLIRERSIDTDPDVYQILRSSAFNSQEFDRLRYNRVVRQNEANLDRHIDYGFGESVTNMVTGEMPEDYFQEIYARRPNRNVYAASSEGMDPGVVTNYK